jgi:4-alpha-glucanotransferase
LPITLLNPDGTAKKSLFHNFHFADVGEVQINGKSLEEEGEISSCDTIVLLDGILGKKMTITLDHPCKVTYFQLKTLSQSEQGFDLSVQGLSLAIAFEFEDSFAFKGSLEISNV